jgi:hypothetical protein
MATLTGDQLTIDRQSQSWPGVRPTLPASTRSEQPLAVFGSVDSKLPAACMLCIRTSELASASPVETNEFFLFQTQNPTRRTQPGHRVEPTFPSPETIDAATEAKPPLIQTNGRIGCSEQLENCIKLGTGERTDGEIAENRQISQRVFASPAFDFGLFGENCRQIVLQSLPDRLHYQGDQVPRSRLGNLSRL